MSSFCSAKATHIFSAKNIRILYIESAKTVNEMTLNELVKLMTFEQLGPDQIIYLHWLTLSFTVGIYPEDTFSHVMAHIIKYNQFAMTILS